MGSLPKLNTANPEVKKYLLEVAEHWIRFGFDGLRVDYPQGIMNREDFYRDLRRVVKGDSIAELIIWGTIFVSGLVTFALRYSFIGFAHRVQTPTWFRQALRFVPAAVLTALVCKALVFYGDRYQLSLTNERLLAGLVAAGVAYRTKNVLWTTVVGMLVLWGLQAALPK